MAARKDYYFLPFLDQTLENVVGYHFYYIDCWFRYCQIGITLKDWAKTTLTVFGIYVCRKMPLGLWNAPTTFKRCMIIIFSKLLEREVEVFIERI